MDSDKIVLCKFIYEFLYTCFIIFLSDKLSNIRSIYSDMLKEGDTVWQKFNQKDPEEYYWYYKCIAEALIDLKDSASWQELSCLISRVFKEETEK